MVNSYQAVNAELCDIEILDKVQNEFQSAYLSCANRQMSLKTKNYSWNAFSHSKFKVFSFSVWLLKITSLPWMFKIHLACFRIMLTYNQKQHLLPTICPNHWALNYRTHDTISAIGKNIFANCFSIVRSKSSPRWITSTWKPQLLSLREWLYSLVTCLFSRHCKKLMNVFLVIQYTIKIV